MTPAPFSLFHLCECTHECRGASGGSKPQLVWCTTRRCRHRACSLRLKRQHSRVFLVHGNVAQFSRTQPSHDTGAARPGVARQRYRVDPGRRNWQIETAAWIWPSFFHCALETRWLGVRKTCGIGLFYRNYRPLLQETGWLGSDFISVCLETRWLGQKRWFLSPGLTL